MKEHPILFSTPMVQAILEGRKTQTRRTTGFKEVNDTPDINDYLGTLISAPQIHEFTRVSVGAQLKIIHEVCRYGQPGDLLWVRETFAWTVGEHEAYDTLSFRADDFHKDVKRPEVDYPESEMCLSGWHDPDLSKELKWKPSIHMKKEYARLWLQIEDIRVERLQDISQEDAIAEGIELLGKHSLVVDKPYYKNYDTNDEELGWLNPINSFDSLWRKINGTKSWDANPWVWVVKFKEISRTGKTEKVAL